MSEGNSTVKVTWFVGGDCSGQVEIACGRTVLRLSRDVKPLSITKSGGNGYDPQGEKELLKVISAVMAHVKGEVLQ